MSIFSALKSAVADRRKDTLRVAVQTAAASAATYLVMSWFGLPHMSWAVISALFTIQLSPDSALSTALGRLGGSLLGVALGLGAGAFVGGEGGMLLRLLVAATAANAVATLWPNLRYAAVTAAIVTLHDDPELAGSLEIAFAILVGSVMGTVATFVAWPDLGRWRTERALRNALCDCRRLLELTVKEVGDGDRREQDQVHARFLRNLESARARAAQTWLRPKLPGGVRFSDALIASESLWHGLVILDRVVSEERDKIGADTLAKLQPQVEEVQRVAFDFIDAVVERLHDKRRTPPSSDALEDAVAGARRAASELGAGYGDRIQNEPRARGIHALLFALDEVERRLVEISSLICGPGGTAEGSPR
jgi:uncharacterized membrane protein YccC